VQVPLLRLVLIWLLPKEMRALTSKYARAVAADQDLDFNGSPRISSRGEREHQWPVRQYFPKGTDLSVPSQAHLNKVARQLNERPGETLQFDPPQRDLTPVLRRPVELAHRQWTFLRSHLTSEKCLPMNDISEGGFELRPPSRFRFS
jgi:hypothetical protein